MADNLMPRSWWNGSYFRVDGNGLYIGNKELTFERFGKSSVLAKWKSPIGECSIIAETLELAIRDAVPFAHAELVGIGWSDSTHPRTLVVGDQLYRPSMTGNEVVVRYLFGSELGEKLDPDVVPQTSVLLESPFYWPRWAVDGVKPQELPSPLDGEWEIAWLR